MARGISPETDLGANLGSATQRWNKLFVDEVDANSITMPSSGKVAYMNDLINSFADPAEAHNSIYRGAEITDDWATIKANIQAGDFSNYYIGDWKQITLTTNEVVIMEIAGINCYKNWGNTAIGNHIDFISRDCLATAYQFNTTATNNGTAGNGTSGAPQQSPWISSALRQKLNYDVDSVYEVQLPSDLKSVIGAKLAYVEFRYSSGGTVSADTNATWQSLGYIWIPSEIEVNGHATYSEIGYGTAGFQQYPIFRLNPAKIIKGAGNGGVRADWWKLSANRSNSSGFTYTTIHGVASSTNASNTLYVPLCFRIA